MRTQIIAELASNHGGDLALACGLISAAADAGADWVKVQAYRPECLQADDPQREWLAQAALSTSGLEHLKAHADAIGVKFLASVFDQESATVVRGLGCETVKIGSGEVNRQGLIDRVAALGFRTLFRGYGCSSLDVWSAWCHDGLTIVPFYGISQYPTPELRAASRIKRIVAGHVEEWGWSDHCYTLKACQEAMEWGATYVERHVAFPDRGRCQDWDSHPTAFKTLRRYAEACAWDGTQAYETARATFLGRWRDGADA
jgi:sialic acid synthase SpsE